MRRSVLVLALLVHHVGRADEPPKRGGPAPGAATGDTAEIELAATANLARGLVDRTLATLRGTLSATAGDWGAFVQPYWVYGTVNGNKTDDERFLRAIGFRAIGARAFVFAVGVYEHSFHREIGDRLFGGGGAGYNVVRSKAASLLVSAGVVGERTAYSTPELADGGLLAGGTRTTARASLRVYGRYRPLGDWLVLVHDLYLMPSILQSDDLRAIVYAGVDVPLVHGLAARVAVDASYEQVIVAGTQHDDLALTFGLSYGAAWGPAR